AGNVAPGVGSEKIARLLLVASSTKATTLTDSNTDIVRTVPGVAVTINKSVAPDTARPGDLLTFAVNVASTGSLAPDPIDVTINGAAQKMVMLRDVIPANTTFADWTDSPADATRLYHVGGAALNSYVSAAPSDPGAIDAIALGLPVYGSANRLLRLAFRVRINDNASSEISNIAELRYRNPRMPGGADMVIASSNRVRVALPVNAARIGYFTDATYLSPASQTGRNAPLFIEGSTASCNADPTRIETTFFTITSAMTGDSERVEALETGPNTGTFRVRVPVPTDMQSAATANNGTMETRPRDRLTARLDACDGTNVLAEIVVAPFGMVYDSRTNEPVSGARVSLLNNQTGAVVASTMTGANGMFEFLTVPAGTWRLRVEPPTGHTFPSQVPMALQPRDRLLHANGSFGRAFVMNGQNNVLAFDVPLDGSAPGGLFAEKTASRQVVGLTDVLDYRITVRNLSGVRQTNVTLVDDLPRGFVYLTGSARRTITAAGNAAATVLPDPVGGVGPRLQWTLVDLNVGDEFVLSYRVRIGAGALSGTATNRAVAQGQTLFGATVSNTATATVRVQPNLFLGRGVLIGKVFVDANNNRLQDEGEDGIPGVRIVLENGTYAVTDSEGKYSIYGLSPSTHVVKLDTTTMPAGARLSPLSHEHALSGSSSFVTLKAGELEKVNFAANNATPELMRQVHERRKAAESAGDEVNAR
ncbi:MAG TPA: SdrD B-like domain-containing protein, partial [Abditibacteriaceae bacterium]